MCVCVCGLWFCRCFVVMQAYLYERFTIIKTTKELYAIDGFRSMKNQLNRLLYEMYFRLILYTDNKAFRCRFAGMVVLSITN